MRRATTDQEIDALTPSTRLQTALPCVCAPTHLCICCPLSNRKLKSPLQHSNLNYKPENNGPDFQFAVKLRVRPGEHRQRHLHLTVGQFAESRRAMPPASPLDWSPHSREAVASCRGPHLTVKRAAHRIPQQRHHNAGRHTRRGTERANQMRRGRRPPSSSPRRRGHADGAAHRVALTQPLERRMLRVIPLGSRRRRGVRDRASRRRRIARGRQHRTHSQGHRHG